MSLSDPNLDQKLLLLKQTVTLQPENHRSTIFFFFLFLFFFAFPFMHWGKTRECDHHILVHISSCCISMNFPLREVTLYTSNNTHLIFCVRQVEAETNTQQFISTSVTRSLLICSFSLPVGLKSSQHRGDLLRNLAAACGLQLSWTAEGHSQPCLDGAQLSLTDQSWVKTTQPSFSVCLTRN